MPDILDRLRGYVSPAWGSALKDMCDAAREIEVLRADARRFEWFEQRCRRVTYMTDIDDPGITVWRIDGQDIASGASVRAAVDARIGLEPAAHLKR